MCNSSGATAGWAVLVNPSGNWLDVTVGGTPCMRRVPRNSTVALVFDAAALTLDAGYCEAAAGACLSPGLDLRCARANASTAAWAPPLRSITSDKPACDDDGDCGGGGLWCRAMWPPTALSAFKFCTRASAAAARARAR